VPDQKPPRDVLDERGTLLLLLNYHRSSLAAKLDGLSDEQISWSPVASGTSLRWLVEHLTRAEHLWILQRYCGHPGIVHRDTKDVSDLLAAYREVARQVDDVVLTAADLDGLTVTDAGGSPVTLRWIVMHLLEETARHAGHADLIRELIDGATGR